MFGFYKKCTNNFHMLFHLAIGFAAGVFLAKFSHYHNVTTLALYGAIAGVIPDLEHVAYFYIYGRKTKYSKAVRSYVRALKVKKLYLFFVKNHKNLHSLYFHNMLTPIILLILTYFSTNADKEITSVMLFSASLHYVYDVIEDLALMKKLNQEWYLRFSRVFSENDSDIA